MGLRLLFLIFLSAAASAQSDSVLCGENCRLNEGVFISYEDFRKNDPVTREQIESSLNKEQLDFFGKTLSQPSFSFQQHGQRIVKPSKNVWGFYQNNVLHLNFNGDFYRVPVFGSISYLVATVEVMNPAMYTPAYGGMVGMGAGGTTQEVRNFLMNFYDGSIQPFSMELAEKLLSRDEEIHKEFRALRPRQRKEQVSRFIRKYNLKHPVYFLK